jgi:quercetin dioxygenase-like cupin family protein
MVEVPAGQMSPLHVHHAEDEGFYVIEGEARFYLPGRELTLRPGDFFLAPRGVPHTYRAGDEGARWLVATTPAGFERFVAGAAALEEPTPQAVAAVAAEYDIEILGPPGALP